MIISRNASTQVVKLYGNSRPRKELPCLPNILLIPWAPGIVEIGSKNWEIQNRQGCPFIKFSSHLTYPIYAQLRIGPLYHVLTEQNMLWIIWKRWIFFIFVQNSVKLLPITLNHMQNRPLFQGTSINENVTFWFQLYNLMILRVLF